MTQSIDELLVGDDTAFDRVVAARLPRIPLALREEHEHLEALLPTLTSDTIDSHPDKKRTADRLLEIEAEIEANVVEVEMRGVGHRAWADLMAHHPPTPAQLKVDRRLDHNPETFPYEAIAASCVPPSTADAVKALTAKAWFNEECWSALWGTCLRVNVSDAAPKSSMAAGLTRLLNGVSGVPATSSASPGASSSAE